MIDVQYPLLDALSFVFALLGGAWFTYFSRTLSQAEAGSRADLLLIDGCVVAIGLSAAALMAGLAFSKSATSAVDADWQLLLFVPLIGWTVLALQMTRSATTIRNTVRAACVLMASTRLSRRLTASAAAG